MNKLIQSFALVCLSTISILICTQKENPTPHKKHKSRSADYVIVGVGTAGALIAKMLSDDLQSSVIALHNGANLTQDPLIKFSATAPITVISALFGSSYYEEGDTIPQSDADDRELLWVVAVPEGGASSINAGAYCRGTNAVYSQWEAIAGPNWSVDRILQAYKQLETYSGTTPNPKARGFHGPLPVRQPQKPTTVSQKFTQALINATGLPFVVDYNNPDTPVGASTQLQYTQSLPDGTLRASSATTFLNPRVMTPDGFGVGGRKLRVLFDATALRTIWKGTKAIGVEYVQNGITKQVFANKKVIVCAGLLSSAFLMHSGIGPKALLKSLNIPVKFNNPFVGQNLADHDIVPLFFTTNPHDTPIPPLDPNNFINNIAWLPDPAGDPAVRVCSFVTLNPVPGLAFGMITLSTTQSRGSITINSADPLQPPVINLGILSNHQDLATYQNLLMVTLKNLNNSLQAIDPGYQLIYPDPAILNDVDAVTQFIQQNIISSQSFQSHCRMAPLNQGGVVDSTGNVYGVKNLVVADDSTIPLCMDGTPMASAYLMGKKIAEEILHSR